MQEMGNDSSVREEGQLATEEAMESAALAIGGSLNQPDGLSTEREKISLEGEKTTFMEIIALKQEPTIGENRDDDNETAEVRKFLFQILTSFCQCL